MIHVIDPTSHKTNGVVTNLGDEIIKESIDLFLKNEGLNFNWVSYNENPKGILILGGANILSKNPWSNDSCWNPIKSLIKSNNVFLLGVGWWQYQSLNKITKFIYRKTFKNNIQSVRDSYTQENLKYCGVKNIINTSCPTTWNLSNDFNSESDSVILTLTDYNKSYIHDKYFIELLLKKYNKCFFWPQGIGDLDYLSELGFTENFEILDRSLSSYDECLINYSAVMVGTRLHAGIRALQKGNSALILSVDNRAIEIKKDINLPVVSRFNLTEIKNILSQELEIMIKSKKTEITLYKELFINNINNIL
jgi:hypothetical protein